ncbi:hypothetical protein BWQ96_09569 [Gracilariopsis chorda]|uniref:Uncharacterized protein n=1 Tax=Gracilariopsis chorda TaxID=448386 RepID=A0A2V3IF74_9FLOR|nr:hypothetical protein BWQ96_09569 [Gracilariopsis chorda]|eukprot:PXF40736.1 hypothetical protein BWQ96_09569 [Gracilariopsis chorda]
MERKVNDTSHSSLVLVKAAQLRQIEKSSRQRSLRKVDGISVQDLVQEFSVYGIDPIKLGFFVITIESDSFSEEILKTISKDELQDITIWNIHEGIKKTLSEGIIMDLGSSALAGLKEMNLSDGRHRLAAVEAFVIGSKIMTSDEFDRTYFIAQIVYKCSTCHAQIISLQKSRKILVTSSCITDVMKCMMNEEMGFTNWKEYASDGIVAQRLLLPDRESVRRVFCFMHALFPSVKAVMEHYRSTKLFMTDSLIRKNNGVHMLGALTGRVQLIHVRCSSSSSKLRGSTQAVKEGPQLLAITTPIAMKLMSTNCHEAELLGQFSVALKTLRHALNTSFQKYIHGIDSSVIISKVRSIIRAFSTASRLFKNESLFTEEVDNVGLPLITTEETIEPKKMMFLENFNPGKEVNYKQGILLKNWEWDRMF